MRNIAAILLALSLASCGWYGGGQYYIVTDKRMEKSTDRYGRELAKEYGLVLLGGGTRNIVDEAKPHHESSTGDPLRIDPEQCLWTLNFITDRTLTLEEARPLAEGIAQDFWKRVLTEPAFAQYHEYFRIHSPCYSKWLSPRDIGFKLAFWDENIERYEYPYLAQIKMVDGKLLYYYAEGKLGPLRPPVVEDVVFPSSGAKE